MGGHWSLLCQDFNHCDGLFQGSQEMEAGALDVFSVPLFEVSAHSASQIYSSWLVWYLGQVRKN